MCTECLRRQSRSHHLPAAHLIVLDWDQDIAIRHLRLARVMCIGLNTSGSNRIRTRLVEEISCYVYVRSSKAQTRRGVGVWVVPHTNATKQSYKTTIPDGDVVHRTEL